MKAIKQWMRVIWPWERWAYAYLSLYVTTSSICYWIVSQIPAAMNLQRSPMLTREIVVVGGAICYGIVRVCGFHPLYRDDYLQFLKQTAWTPSKPLPFGPVHLVWQDAVVIGVLTSMVAYLPMLHLTRICSLALMAYLLFLSKAFIQFSLWKSFYGLLFGLGLAVCFWPDAMVSTCIVLATYYVAYRGLKPSFEKLHETQLGKLIDRAVQGGNSNRSKAIEQRYGRLSGWPFDGIAPRLPSMRYGVEDVYGISTRQGLIVSLLVGWWVFAVSVPIFDNVQRYTLRQIDSHENATTILPRTLEIVIHEWQTPTTRAISNEVVVASSFWVFVALMSLSSGRMSTYMTRHKPPMDVSGRWATGQWLIPAYDKVLIAPLCIFLVAALVYPLFVIVLGISPLFAMPVVTSLMVLCVLNIGPSRVEWQLTAPCQLTRPMEYRNRQFGEFSDS